MKKYLKWAVLALLAIIIVGAVISSNEEKEKEEKRKKDFTQNEIAAYKEVEYSIIKVEKTQGSNYFIKPKDGYEYVKVTLRIENKSNEKIPYNELDWKMVNADGVEDTFGAITAEDDITLSSGQLDPNGKIEGVLIWEQKVGDNNLRLRYYKSMIDENYTLQFKLD